MDGTIANWQKQQAIASLRKEIQQTKKGLASRERKLKRLQDSLLPSMLDKEPHRLDFGFPGDKQETQSIKILAERLIEARHLCGHTAQQAAKLLGVNADDLKKLENAVGIWRVPVWLIKKAAELYNVPSDFLLGLINEFDADDPEAFRGRDLLAALQRQQLEYFTKTANEQINLDGRLKAVSIATVAFGMAVQQISEVFTQFRGLNYVAFDNMPGSTRVLRQIGIAEEMEGHATVLLTRYKCFPESLKAHAEQMNEIFPNGCFAD